MRNLLRTAAAVLLLSAASFAEALSGTVTNGTTSKPAAGDDVILIKLGQGMEEAGRVKSDAQGKFTLNIDDPGPHLIRVVHQGVTYHKMAPPGSTSVELQVFDVSKKLTAISVTADVLRFQAQGNELQGVRLFAVDNTSQPARTQMNDQNFEFYLPEGAQIDSSFAQTEGGQAVNSAPVPQKERNRYAFVFPLRPGETQFQLTFHLPYTGELKFDPKSIYPAQHFVVMLPKTMQFAADSDAFKPMKDPRQSDALVQVATKTAAGQALAFKISGTGLMPEQKEDQSSAQASADPRPGGGLGPPIEAPDPLEKYRWYILGGFALALTAGGTFIAKRSHAEAPAVAEVPSLPPSTGQKSMLLEALKEELFQLEIDRKQGQLTQEEYEKAKAALDQTLDRALKRKPV
ncbi:MAG TPA: carboxypeptidase regulatory-like domain-containing protein [Terriglobales bacterium]|nr:carboxypeptidase regulatory-like domain-containing protein [Terriglobales bacterium]